MGKAKPSDPQQPAGRTRTASAAPTALDRFVARGEGRVERTPLPRARPPAVNATQQRLSTGSAEASMAGGLTQDTGLKNSLRSAQGERAEGALQSPRTSPVTPGSGRAVMQEQPLLPASVSLPPVDPSCSQADTQGTPTHSMSSSPSSWPDPAAGSRSPHLHHPHQDAPNTDSGDSMDFDSHAFAVAPPDPLGWAKCFQQLPTKADFQELISEVKDACRQEIAALRQDIQQVTLRVEDLETEHDTTRTYLSHVHPLLSAQSETIRDMNRHLEDLDNRGRRNNIRVRGLPEAAGTENLTEILVSIFNGLLGTPPTHAIKMDRAHRALRPKGATALPRDVICCVHDFQVKEDFMLKARSHRNLEHDGATIQLFSDLSWITLQKRRHLRPLLDTLREHQIPYRWNFPFALLARSEGRTLVLKVFSDLPDFCKSLRIPIPKMADWDLGSIPPTPSLMWQTSISKRRRPPAEGPASLRLPPSPHR